jgi:hypothetical protein
MLEAPSRIRERHRFDLVFTLVKKTVSVFP